MKIDNQIALVTGTNRGLGKELVKALLEAGVKKIYATSRDGKSLPEFTSNEKIISVDLDIRNSNQVEEIASTCSDTSLLINNAGKNYNVPLIASDNIDSTRDEVETNLFGTLQMCRAFAPILKNNGGGMIVNLVSVLSRVSIPVIGSVCASKGALLMMNNGVRAELAPQNTHVMAVLPGEIDTDMTPGGESKPEDIAKIIMSAIENDEEDIWPGPMAESLKERLLSDPKGVEKEFAAYLPE